MNALFLHDGSAVLRQHRVLNAVHTWLLVGGSLALLAVTAWTIAGVTGLIYATIFGGVTLAAARRISPSAVLRMYRAREVGINDSPEAYRLLGMLARRAGLPKAPTLYLIPSRMLNAFAVGRPDDAAIVVTDGLLRTMNKREVTGILAHEMSHIANEDIKVMSLADMVSRMTSALSTLGMLAILFNISGFFGHIPWLGILAMIAAPTLGSLLQLALSRTREFDADHGAAILTGDPDGLSMALKKLERLQGRGWERMFNARGRAPSSALRTHPKTEDRVARLDAIKDALGTETTPVRPDTLTARPTRGVSPVPIVPLRR